MLWRGVGGGAVAGRTAQPAEAPGHEAAALDARTGYGVLVAPGAEGVEHWAVGSGQFYSLSAPKPPTMRPS